MRALRLERPWPSREVDVLKALKSRCRVGQDEHAPAGVGGGGRGWGTPIRNFRKTHEAQKRKPHFPWWVPSSPNLSP